MCFVRNESPRRDIKWALSHHTTLELGALSHHTLAASVDALAPRQHQRQWERDKEREREKDIDTIKSAVGRTGAPNLSQLTGIKLLSIIEKLLAPAAPQAPYWKPKASEPT